MASACVNTIIDVPPSDFPAYGWLSPRISEKKILGAPEVSDPATDHGDFEFHVDEPAQMLPADELFSDGKLVPLQFCASFPAPAATEEAMVSPAGRKWKWKSVADDRSVFSPKAPRGSSRWRELLGLRKSKSNDTTSLPSSSSSKSIRQFLHRTSKSMSASDASLRLPLLKESDSDPISIASSRFSLSSGDDFARLSLDAADLKPSRLNHNPNLPRVRMAKPRMPPISVTENPKPLIDHPPVTTNRLIPRRFSTDSPRMISSGKIVFESLERSCSSPSTFNGGPRLRNRAVERSYSANVRIAPVLNVSGILGFSQLFSSQSKKKEGNNGSSKLHNYHHCNTVSAAKR